MRTRQSIATVTAVALVSALGLSACGTGGSSESGASADGVITLSIYIDSDPLTSIALWDSLVEKFNSSHDKIQISYETHPGGSEGDNLVKTRLATGDMNDLLWYNSGSLLKALRPDETLVDLSDQEWTDKVNDNWKQAVSTDSGLYELPVGTSFAFGMIYNKDIYKNLGLKIPRSWDEFMANNEKIKAAGITPVVQTYSDTWSSQIPVLGDAYNVMAADPDWADKYTANKAKYVDEPAIQGFQHMQDVFDRGYMNDDFASATYNDGMKMLAEGTGAHYPMLTSNAAAAIGQNYPDADSKIGVFPIPSDSPEINGLTIGTPKGMSIPKSTKGDKLKAAIEVLNWLATPQACEAIGSAIPVGGPFVIDGCDVPEGAASLISDMTPYFDEGKTGLALEFLSPIKGPSLEQITVQVGSGISSAAEGAALYDQDVEKQAQQLGLKGW
ncbi:carbohydrate ABC transporter substrate-binding protein [Schaalia sp. ZJ405]|uniref:ABC transporter substrate-binding protein n=1 Tax=Schaalia sp. ZJ405 TaxID=2709403 RepID=UPI0013EA8AEB|nr:ABC transporter substrate-binding protein [Schaalia sp. ZJ405]QPK81242.1 carbohydrate ABC transporter substrate-binding protein [Schaalia sp. ZJ405]